MEMEPVQLYTAHFVWHTCSIIYTARLFLLWKLRKSIAGNCSTEKRLKWLNGFQSAVIFALSCWILVLWHTAKLNIFSVDATQNIPHTSATMFVFTLFFSFCENLVIFCRKSSYSVLLVVNELAWQQIHLRFVELFISDALSRHLGPVQVGFGAVRVRLGPMKVRLGPVHVRPLQRMGPLEEKSNEVKKQWPSQAKESMRPHGKRNWLLA